MKSFSDYLNEQASPDQLQGMEIKKFGKLVQQWIPVIQKMDSLSMSELNSLWEAGAKSQTAATQYGAGSLTQGAIQKEAPIWQQMHNSNLNDLLKVLSIKNSAQNFRKESGVGPRNVVEEFKKLAVQQRGGYYPQ